MAKRRYPYISSNEHGTASAVQQCRECQREIEAGAACRVLLVQYSWFRGDDEVEYAHLSCGNKSVADRRAGPKGETYRDQRWTIPEGTPQKSCRGCGAPIFFVPYVRKRGPKAGQQGKMPTNPDGIPHFATCPKAPEFRKG